MFNNPLKEGDVIDNSELVAIFGCSPQGGMRRSHKTNTLVIVSNHVKSVYRDRWDGKILHYTGEGKSGDQSLERRQNKTLNESTKNGVAVHLFEVHKSESYTYTGQVELVDPPYSEEQVGENGKTRMVWMFPLRLRSGNDPPPVSLTDYRDEQERRRKKISKCSDSELKEKLPSEDHKPEKRTAYSQVYTRNPYVVTAALRRADGICQLCSSPAPFKRSNGSAFLEVHHIKPLAEDGEDTLKNSVALCPNCHRKMHSLKKKTDVTKLSEKASNLGAYA